MANSASCPKCGGTMIKGRLYTVATERREINKMFGYVNWEATEEKKFDGIFAFKCGKCGFIEFYALKK